MVARLPREIEAIAADWGLELGDPYLPGGQCAWVAPARNRAGDELALKVGWRHREAEHEADALRLWDGDGTVCCFVTATFDDTTGLLLERCVPGAQLKCSLPEPEQDLVLAALMRRLWEHRPPDGHPFGSLEDMCHQWADWFELDFDTDPRGLDPSLAREGITTLRELAGAPLEQLAAASRLSEQLHARAEELLDQFVDAARASGSSWSEIGFSLGTSKQAAQQRFAALAEPPPGQAPFGLTGTAADVLTDAAAQARELGHHFIAPEHLVLGLLGQPQELAGEALAALGITLEDARARVEHRLGAAAPRPAGSLGAVPQTKRLLALAHAIAKSLGSRCAKTEHILLAATSPKLHSSAATLLATKRSPMHRIENSELDPSEQLTRAHPASLRSDLHSSDSSNDTPCSRCRRRGRAVRLLRGAARSDRGDEQHGGLAAAARDHRQSRNAPGEHRQTFPGTPSRHSANRTTPTTSSKRNGLRWIWIDLEGACRGPQEWDLAFLSADACTQFPDIDHELLKLLRTLNSARVATWCWARYQHPDMRWHAHHHLEVVRTNCPA